jgi:hypothetical protein
MLRWRSERCATVVRGDQNTDRRTDHRRARSGLLPPMLLHPGPGFTEIPPEASRKPLEAILAVLAGIHRCFIAPCYRGVPGGHPTMLALRPPGSSCGPASAIKLVTSGHCMGDPPSATRLHRLAGPAVGIHHAPAAPPRLQRRLGNDWPARGRPRDGRGDGGVRALPLRQVRRSGRR